MEKKIEELKDMLSQVNEIQVILEKQIKRYEQIAKDDLEIGAKVAHLLMKMGVTGNVTKIPSPDRSNAQPLDVTKWPLPGKIHKRFPTTPIWVSSNRPIGGCMACQQSLINCRCGIRYEETGK